MDEYNEKDFIGLIKSLDLNKKIYNSKNPLEDIQLQNLNIVMLV